jgi:lysine 2,3-aminomutase
VILRNYEGVLTVYTEPDDNQSRPEELYHWEEYTARQRELSREGLIKLYEGDSISLEPADLDRRKRGKA